MPKFLDVPQWYNSSGTLVTAVPMEADATPDATQILRWAVGGYARWQYFDVNGATPTRIYAPTSAGTAGQLLVSTGSGAPEWVNSDTVGGGTVYFHQIQIDCEVLYRRAYYNTSLGTWSGQSENRNSVGYLLRYSTRSNAITELSDLCSFIGTDAPVIGTLDSFPAYITAWSTNTINIVATGIEISNSGSSSTSLSYINWYTFSLSTVTAITDTVTAI